MSCGFALAFLSLLTAAPTAYIPAVSDPAAVYALVTKVELLPNTQTPQRVRVHGAFAIAEGKRGQYYRSPQWGSLLFHTAEGKEVQCRNEWADLVKIAGSGKPVSFGFRYRAVEMKVQPPGRESKTSAVYPVGLGMQKVRNVDYGPALALRMLPRPVAPLADVAVREHDGRVGTIQLTLVAENCADREAGAGYAFEIERQNGDVVASPLIPAGDKQTSWQVWVALRPGEQVTWRVRVVRDDVVRAPVARARFVAKAKAG